MTSDEWEELYSAARRAARRVVLSWPDNVEADDLSNDIMVRLLEAPGSVARTLEEDDRTRQSFLIKLGHQIASDSQADYDFFSGNYLYDAKTVRELLKDGLITDEPYRFKAEKHDLLAALEVLKDNDSSYYAELINRFVHDIVPHWTDKTANKRVDRAIEALTGQMNRIGAAARSVHEGPGNREVISNSLAEYITGDSDV